MEKLRSNGEDLSNFENMAAASNIHPVRFNHEQHCSVKETKYRQLVEHGDETQFQMMMDICATEQNIVSNPVFSTLDDWITLGTVSINTTLGRAVKEAGTVISGIYQDITVADDVLVNISLEIEIQSGSVGLFLGSETIEISQSGSYSFFILAENVSTVGFLTSATAEWYLTSVGVYAVNTNFVVRVVDLDGDVIRELDPVNHPSYFDFTREWFTFSYNWADQDGEYLPEGCYRFLVSDPCPCSNGGFVAEDLITVQNQWVNSAGAWSFNGTGVAVFTASETTDDAFINNAMCDAVEYEVSYELAGMGTGNIFYVRAGSQTGIFRTLSGSYTETITANTAGSDAFAIVGVDGGGGAFQLLNLKVRRKERTFGFRSNIFHLKEDTGCTALISACCDSDNMQAGYGDTPFTPRIRIAADYGKPTYPPIASRNFKGAFGRKLNTYFRGEKIKILAYSAPEYVHDFLGQIAGYDHAYLDGNPIFINSTDYDPDWDDDYDFGTVELEVSEKVERIEKRRCSSVSNGCGGGGVPLAIDSSGKDDGSLIEVDATTEGETADLTTG